MRWLILLFILCSCEQIKDCPEEEYYATEDGQQIIIGCGKLSYFRSAPECFLKAEYIDIENNNILWNLQKTCSHNDSWIALCLLQEDDRYGFDGMRLSCQELGIHRVFERVK